VLKPEWIAKVPQLQTVASDLGCSISQMALAWCLMNPQVSSVITGASRVEQVKENMKATEVVTKFTPYVVEQIELILNNKPGR
jgi:aryl-alcohol dehydrogenase-like predicted oxidoreductase